MIEFTDRHGRLVIAAIEYATAGDRAQLLEVCAPAGRDQLRAALDALAARETRWRELATPGQRAIGWGDYFTHRWAGLRVYGRVLGLEEFKARERAASPTMREYRESLRHTLAAYERGWRYSDCYSQVTPEGEPGDVHVAVMEPLPAARFAAARAAGWPLEVPA